MKQDAPIAPLSFSGLLPHMQTVFIANNPLNIFIARQFVIATREEKSNNWYY